MIYCLGLVRGRVGEDLPLNHFCFLFSCRHILSIGDNDENAMTLMFD